MLSRRWLCLTLHLFQVLERGLKAIPLSVDLWIHYLNHVKATRAEDHTYIRSQYERAIGKLVKRTNFNSYYRLQNYVYILLLVNII